MTISVLTIPRNKYPVMAKATTHQNASDIFSSKVMIITIIGLSESNKNITLSMTNSKRKIMLLNQDCIFTNLKGK